METVASMDVDDQTVMTTVEELARLKKVLVFVDSIIANADMELTPKSVWANCLSQSEACLQQARSYESNRNVAYLIQANEHADNLLTYVRPYMILPQQALEAFGKAERAFVNQISQYVKSFQEQTQKVQVRIETALSAAVNQQQQIADIESRAKQFDEYLFEGVDGNNPAEKYVKEMVFDIKEKQDRVEILYKTLFEGPESTYEKIKVFKEEAEKTHRSMNKMINSALARDEEIERFYERIFGRQAADGEEVQEVGLNRELDLRLQQLTDHEELQTKRQEALFVSIESLLPGATSAGLASAYKKIKDKFNIPIIGYTIAFYAAMLTLFLGGLTIVSENINLSPFHFEFVKTSTWEEMIRTLLTRGPIILPVIWVAIFSATRRSQYERLQQEYAHKEAFASSYESYKNQLQALQIDADVLQKELIARAIEAISFNASNTLDGKHTEKMPIHRLLEKFSLEELKKLVELAKKE
jgi:hypothetical protein